MTEYNRRDFMDKLTKTGVAASAIGTLGTTGTARAATSSPTKEWSANTVATTDKCGNWDLRVGHGIDVGFYGAYWISSRNAWEYNFRQNTCAGSDQACDGSKTNLIEQQETYVTQGTAPAIGDFHGPDYVGVYPELSYNPYDYTDLAWDLAEIAVSKASDVVNYLLTVNEVLNDMHNDTGAVSADYPVHHDWDYYSQSSYQYGDVTHYKWWTVDAVPNDESWFDIYSKVYALLDTNTSINMTFKCAGGNDPTEGKIGNLSTSGTKSQTPPSTEYSPRMDAPLSEWNIEKIRPRNISNRASELGLPPHAVEHFENTGEPMYYAHTPPVMLEAVETTGEHKELTK